MTKDASQSQDAPSSRAYTRYLAVIALTISVLTGSVLAVNFVVDPLWFDKGNRLASHNHHYNERYSKLNVFLQDPKKYDCIILGSSTATLLNGGKIDGYTCHNMSFSRAHLQEYTDYLRFMKQYADDIKLVVVGFDGYILIEKEAEEDHRTPPFLKNNAPLPSAFRAYLGLGPFTASVKNLLNYTVSSRYYDKEFNARILPTAGRYRPEDEGFDANFRQRFGHALGRFDTDKLRYVQELRSVAPNAKFVAYVPPIAAQYISFLKLENKLDGYVDAMHRSAAEFDAYYDFTVPSAVTENPENTNDGMHYTRAINDQIAATISDGDPRFGIDVKRTSLQDYRGKVYEATEAFVAAGHINGYQQASVPKAGATKAQ